MKLSNLILAILPLALAAPIAEPEPASEIEARQGYKNYGTYGDKKGGYGS